MAIRATKKFDKPQNIGMYLQPIVVQKLDMLKAKEQRSRSNMVQLLINKAYAEEFESAGARE